MVRWTKEEENELVGLVRARSFFEGLAERFSRGPRAVKARLKRVGIYLAASEANVTGSSRDS